MAPRRARREPEVRRVGAARRGGRPGSSASRTTASTTRPASSKAPRSRRPRGRLDAAGAGQSPDRHRPAAAQPGPAGRRLHQPRLRGERRLQRRHLLAPLPPVRFLCGRPGAQGRGDPRPARDRQGPARSRSSPSTPTAAPSPATASSSPSTRSSGSGGGTGAENPWPSTSPASRPGRCSRPRSRPATGPADGRSRSATPTGDASSSASRTP